MPKCDLDAFRAVLSWTIAGNTEDHILEALSDKFPSAKRQAVIRAVTQRLRDSGNPDPELLRGFCLESYRDLYRRMLEIGDYANAAKILKELHRIATDAVRD